MSKNQVQYQKGYSLLELFKDYGTEEQCTLSHKLKQEFLLYL